MFKETDIVKCTSGFCSRNAGKPLLCSTKITHKDFPYWSSFKTVLEAANQYPKNFELVSSNNYEIY